MKKIKIEGKPLEHETLRATNVYFMTYMVIFAVSVLLVSIENKDLVTNFAAVAATFNNIGPGLSLVGPMANFGHFTDFTKLYSDVRYAGRQTGDFPDDAVVLPGCLETEKSLVI